MISLIREETEIDSSIQKAPKKNNFQVKIIKEISKPREKKDFISFL